MDWQLALGLITFITGAITITRSLWQFYQIKTELENKIRNVAESLTDNKHRIDLIELKGEHLIDQQTLAINGMKEVLQHVRERSLENEEKLSYRIQDLERFLEKSTAFVTRT